MDTRGSGGQGRGLQVCVGVLADPCGEGGWRWPVGRCLSWGLETGPGVGERWGETLTIMWCHLCCWVLRGQVASNLQASGSHQGLCTRVALVQENNRSKQLTLLAQPKLQGFQPRQSCTQDEPAFRKSWRRCGIRVVLKLKVIP